MLPLILLALAPRVVSKCAIKIYFLSNVILPYGRVIFLPSDNSAIESLRVQRLRTAFLR